MRSDSQLNWTLVGKDLAQHKTLGKYQLLTHQLKPLSKTFAALLLNTKRIPVCYAFIDVYMRVCLCVLMNVCMLM